MIGIPQHTLDVVGVRRVDCLFILHRPMIHRQQAIALINHTRTSEIMATHPNFEPNFLGESFHLFQVKFDRRVRSTIFPVPQQRA
jgi:hypothetical protein